MSFAQEINSILSEQKSQIQSISDEELYSIFLQGTIDNIKQCIRYKAQEFGRSEGEYKLINAIQYKTQSNVSKKTPYVTLAESRITINEPAVVSVRTSSSLFSSEIVETYTITMTEAGIRICSDLQRYFRGEGITISPNWIIEKYIDGWYDWEKGSFNNGQYSATFQKKKRKPSSYEKNQIYGLPQHLVLSFSYKIA